MTYQYHAKCGTPIPFARVEAAMSEAVAHWQRMRDERRQGRLRKRQNGMSIWGVELPIADDCALCKLFEKPYDCGDCPVKQITGDDFCKGSPFSKALDALLMLGRRDPAPIQAEVEFLERARRNMRR